MPPDTSKTALTPSGAASGAPEKTPEKTPEPTPELPLEPHHADLLAALTPQFNTLLSPYPHVVLAVSGGSDSMALLHLVSAWAAGAHATPVPTLSVVTIDHALRPGSAAEAQFVAVEAARLGLGHTTLLWEGDKPATGIQAAARRARFALIGQHLLQRGWPVVAMAHTADDQAETMLMRLARGSGIDGLAAMRPKTTLGARLGCGFGPGYTLIRPLLGTTKSELVTTLRTRSLAWMDDPSNHAPRFERVRLRRARAILAAEGIDLASTALARSAQRLGRASAALAQMTANAWAGRGHRAHLDPLGFATLDWAWLLEQPEDIRLRLLAGLLDAIGGQPEAMSLGQLERLTMGRDWYPLTGTVHGVDIQQGRSGLVLAREWGRRQPKTTDLFAGAPKPWPLLWDGRFVLNGAPLTTTDLTIRSLGPEGLAALRAPPPPATLAPTRALWSLPAVFSGFDLVAVPSLGFFAGALALNTVRGDDAPLTCTFVGPAFASPAPSAFRSGQTGRATERDV